MSQRLRDELERRVSAQARVLDFGCGDGGLYGRWLADGAGSYLGLDISAVAVEKAAARGLDARRIENESEMGVPSGDFDVAIAIEVLEHLFAPQLAAQELHRALAPGGVLIATVPNVAYWTARLGLGLIGRWNPYGDPLSIREPWRDPHLRFFTVAALDRMLRQAGFREVDIHGHDGAFLAEIPLLRRVLRRRGSVPYRLLESLLPSVFGAGLLAVARKG